MIGTFYTSFRRNFNGKPAKPKHQTPVASKVNKKRKRKSRQNSR